MGRRSDHSREELREMALSAAETILEEVGPGGMTARRIAERIGYTVGTLYLVFANLDDLTVQVNGRTLDRLNELASAAITSSDDPRTAIRNVATAYANFARDHRGRWLQLFNPRQDPDSAFPDWYLAKVRALFGLIDDALIELGFAPEDAENMTRALWGAVHGICTLNDSALLDIGREPGSGLTPALDLLLTHALHAPKGI